MVSARRSGHRAGPARQLPALGLRVEGGGWRVEVLSVVRALLCQALVRGPGNGWSVMRRSVRVLTQLRFVVDCDAGTATTT